MIRVLVLLALTACDQAANVGKVIVAGGPVAGVEAYCAIADDARCGLVYACETEADNAIGLVEICVSDLTPVAEAEERFGPCELSPHERFDALGHRCWWDCGVGHRGCNAFSGCLCP